MRQTATPTLYMTLGFPGSGKTYFAKQFLTEDSIFHLSSDRLRLEMFDQPNYSPEESTAVFRVVGYFTEELLRQHVSVILDANSNRRIRRDPLYNLAQKAGARSILLWFRLPEVVALARIGKRGDGNDKYFRTITPETFHNLKNEIEKPDPDERYVAIDGTQPYPDQISQLRRQFAWSAPKRARGWNPRD